MGLLRTTNQPRRPRLLRPTPRRRRPAPSSPACPGQPTRRHPARLPTPPHPLQRTHRLGTPPNHPSRLTTYEPGMSTRANRADLMGRQPEVTLHTALSHLPVQLDIEWTFHLRIGQGI